MQYAMRVRCAYGTPTSSVVGAAAQAQLHSAATDFVAPGSQRRIRDRVRRKGTAGRPDGRALLLVEAISGKAQCLGHSLDAFAPRCLSVES